MNSTEKKVWIILEHPQELFVALPIILNAPGNLKFGLIASDHKYWKFVDLKPYEKKIAEIFFFGQLHRVHSLSDIWNFIKKSYVIKKMVKTLPIMPDDVFLTFSHVNYVENIITSIFHHNKQIYIVRDWIYNHLGSKTLKDVIFSKDAIMGKSDIIHHLILEPLLGLRKRTINYWYKHDLSHHDTTYTKDLKLLYNKVFLLSSVYKRDLDIEEIYYPYILLFPQNHVRPNHMRKKIVFFMSALLQKEDFAKPYYEYSNRLLQSLRNYYKGYDLIIRLHPNLHDIHEKIDWHGWTINQENGSGEQYILNHFNEIEAVFSNISTILIFPLNLGLPAYCYYKVFEFDEIHKVLRDHVFAHSPEEFYMQSLEERPKSYKPELPDLKNQVKISLEKIYESILN